MTKEEARAVIALRGAILHVCNNPLQVHVERASNGWIITSYDGDKPFVARGIPTAINAVQRKLESMEVTKA